jgi:hypothetical protein
MRQIAFGARTAISGKHRYWCVSIGLMKSTTISLLPKNELDISLIWCCVVSWWTLNMCQVPLNPRSIEIDYIVNSSSRGFFGGSTVFCFF